MKAVALSRGWLRKEIIAALDRMIETSYVPEETKRRFETARRRINSTTVLEVDDSAPAQPTEAFR
jgi:hypothetical protein